MYVLLSLIYSFIFFFPVPVPKCRLYHYSDEDVGKFWAVTTAVGVSFYIPVSYFYPGHLYSRDKSPAIVL